MSDPNIQAAFEQLCAVEPELRALFNDAAQWRLVATLPIERLCANQVWKGAGLESRLNQLVGAGARNRTLENQNAYELAYSVIYGQLPECRNCNCEPRVAVQEIHPGSACILCKCRIPAADGCAASFWRIRGKIYWRLPYAGGWDAGDGRCSHCGIEIGRIHHPGCSIERCSICKRRLISCGHLMVPLRQPPTQWQRISEWMHWRVGRLVRLITRLWMLQTPIGRFFTTALSLRLAGLRHPWRSAFVTCIVMPYLPHPTCLHSEGNYRYSPPIKQWRWLGKTMWQDNAGRKLQRRFVDLYPRD